jgi:hypothetical protein
MRNLLKECKATVLLFILSLFLGLFFLGLSSNIFAGNGDFDGASHLMSTKIYMDHFNMYYNTQPSSDGKGSVTEYMGDQDKIQLFNDFSLVFLKHVNTHPRVVADINLRDFVSFLQHMSLNQSLDSRMYDWQESRFYDELSYFFTTGGEEIFPYMSRLEVTQGEYLFKKMRTYQSVSWEELVEFLKIESDFLYLSAYVRQQIQGVMNDASDKRDVFKHFIGIKKQYEVLGDHSFLRVLLFLRRALTLDPNLLPYLRNQMTEGQIFHIYGRFGQVGGVCENILKFEDKYSGNRSTFGMYKSRIGTLELLLGTSSSYVSFIKQATIHARDEKFNLINDILTEQPHSPLMMDGELLMESMEEWRE